MEVEHSTAGERSIDGIGTTPGKRCESRRDFQREMVSSDYCDCEKMGGEGVEGLFR